MSAKRAAAIALKQWVCQIFESNQASVLYTLTGFIHKEQELYFNGCRLLNSVGHPEVDYSRFSMAGSAQYLSENHTAEVTHVHPVVIYDNSHLTQFDAHEAKVIFWQWVMTTGDKLNQ